MYEKNMIENVNVMHEKILWSPLRRLLYFEKGGDIKGGKSHGISNTLF